MHLRIMGIGFFLAMVACGKDPATTASGGGTQPQAVSAATPAPKAAPGNSVSAQPGDPTVCVAGWLTQKGSEPMTFWAITDSTGTVWEVTNPEAIATARTNPALLEAPVAVIGRRIARVPFTGIRVLDLRAGTCPEGVAGGF